MGSYIGEFIHKNSYILEFLTKNMPDLMFLMAVDEKMGFRYVLMNPAAQKVTGLSEQVYGKSLEEVLPPNRANTLREYYLEVVVSKQPVTYVENCDGLYGETILTPILSDADVCTHVLAITRDITLHETYQRQLSHLANHDPLTGLSNRRFLMESLRTLEQGAIERKRILAVMYMDCDKFKRINDTFGHDIGDEFLIILSKRLRHCLKDADLICRLGGDEFIAITSIQKIDNIEKIGMRVLQTVNQPVIVQSQVITESMSMGIALYPTDGPDLDIVMKKADQVLQKVKGIGGNQCVVYHSWNPSVSI